MQSESDIWKLDSEEAPATDPTAPPASEGQQPPAEIPSGAQPAPQGDTEQDPELQAMLSALPPQAHPAWRGYRSEARAYKRLRDELGVSDEQAIRDAHALQQSFHSDPAKFWSQLDQRDQQQAARLKQELLYAAWDTPEWRDALIKDAQARGLISGSQSPTPEQPPAADTLIDRMKRVIADPLAGDDERIAAEAVIELHGLKEKFPTLEKTVSGLTSERDESRKNDYFRALDDLDKKFFGETGQFAEKLLDEMGLAATPDDPEKADKERIRTRALSNIVNALRDDPANKQVVGDIVSAAGDLNEQKLMSYLPQVKIWIDAYLKRETKPDLDLLERARQRQRDQYTERTDKEVPGSSGISLTPQARLSDDPFDDLLLKERALVGSPGR